MTMLVRVPARVRRAIIAPVAAATFALAPHAAAQDAQSMLDRAGHALANARQYGGNQVQAISSDSV